MTQDDFYREQARAMIARREDETPDWLSEEWADPAFGQETPCVICGAPINRDGEGHDDGCMGLDS